EHFRAPLAQLDHLAVAVQPQAGLAAAGRGAQLVAPDGLDLLPRVGRAFGQEAMQEKDVQEPHRVRGDADGREGIEVHRAHLYVLDPALAQRVQRPLARADDALRPDGAVELVLDLQEAGRELAVVAFAVADADRLVRRVGLGEHVVETARIALDAVVAHREPGLRFAQVAQAPPAQRPRVRQGERAGRELFQRVLAARDEARAHRGRGTEAA